MTGMLAADMVSQDESLAIFDPYDILEISAHSTAAEIKKAYFKKSKQFHPDKNPDPRAPEKFRRAAKAYEVWSRWRLTSAAAGRDGAKQSGIGHEIIIRGVTVASRARSGAKSAASTAGLAQALTDPAGISNLRKYGHPDGHQGCAARRMCAVC
jgi:preprotein translocase subunit Sec63